MANSIAYGGRYYRRRKGYASQAPSIASVNFSLADNVGGDLITVTGSRLLSAIAVTVGGTPTQIVARSNTSVRFRMPPKSVGTHDLQVTTINGQSNVLPIEAWSPAELNLTVFCKAPFAGTTWYGSPSVGTSGTRHLSENTTPPSSGTAVDGTTPARFDGSNDYLQVSDGSSVMFTAAAGSVMVGFKMAAATSDAGANLAYNNPAFVLGNAVAVTFSTSGFRAGVDDTTNPWDAQAISCSTGTWNIGTLRWNGSTEQIALNNTSFSSQASLNVDVASGVTWFGRSSSSQYINGDVMFIICSPTTFTDSTVTKVMQWARAKWPSAFS